MSKKFSDMLDEAINVTNINRNLEDYDDMIYKLQKLLDKKSVLSKQILYYNKGYKTDLDKIEKLLGQVESIFGDIHREIKSEGPKY